MERQTNLRALRHRYGLLLTELESVSGISNQYISRAELGQIQPTERLETQLGTALETIIARRGSELQSLKKDYARCKGQLLRSMEGVEHEQ